MTLLRLLSAVVISSLLVGVASRTWECYETHAMDGLQACVWPILVKEDTEYASGFSHVRFRQVAMGMVAEDVVRVLGPPLEKRTLEGGREEWWSWSRSRRDHSYRVRGVLLEGGRVTKVVHEFYVD